MGKHRELAREATAVWVRTSLFEDGSPRLCDWDAPSPETPHGIFARTGVTGDRIAAVREVLPGRRR